MRKHLDPRCLPQNGNETCIIPRADRPSGRPWTTATSAAFSGRPLLLPVPRPGPYNLPRWLSCAAPRLFHGSCPRLVSRPPRLPRPASRHTHSPTTGLSRAPPILPEISPPSPDSPLLFRYAGLTAGPLVLGLLSEGATLCQTSLPPPRCA